MPISNGELASLILIGIALGVTVHNHIHIRRLLSRVKDIEDTL